MGSRNQESQGQTIAGANNTIIVSIFGVKFTLPLSGKTDLNHHVIT